MKDGRAFLENLIGEWTLTGKMGEVHLRQEVSASWVLRGLFVSMYCRSTAPDDNPTSDYEALYHIGFNEEEELYVFHLLDTTAVPISCDMGRGRRQANRIPFLFEYGDTKFFNIMTWHAPDGIWTFRQEYEEDGGRKIFAEKEMISAS